MTKIPKNFIRQLAQTQYTKPIVIEPAIHSEFTIEKLDYLHFVLRVRVQDISLDIPVSRESMEEIEHHLFRLLHRP